MYPTIRYNDEHIVLNFFRGYSWNVRIPQKFGFSQKYNLCTDKISDISPLSLKYDFLDGDEGLTYIIPYEEFFKLNFYATYVSNMELSFCLVKICLQSIRDYKQHIYVGDRMYVVLAYGSGMFSPDILGNINWHYYSNNSLFSIKNSIDFGFENRRILIQGFYPIKELLSLGISQKNEINNDFDIVLD